MSYPYSLRFLLVLIFTSIMTGFAFGQGRDELPFFELDKPDAPIELLPPTDEEIAETVVDDTPIFEVAEVEQWFSLDSWDSSFEIGLNGAEGNSQTFTVQTGFSLERKTEYDVSDIRLRYAMSRAESAETQNYAILKTSYERLMHESPWSMYLKSDSRYDRFKPFDLRLVLNGGMALTYVDTKYTNLKSRLGAGTSREFGGPDDTWTPEANFGLDFKKQLTKRQKLTASFDYFPEWGQFNDYRAVSDVSWELVLDADANLSLKLNIEDRYDSTPNGARANDVLYAFLLLWSL